MSNSIDSCEIKPKQKFYQSFQTAFRGIITGLSCERNFQIHLVMAVITIFLMLFLGGTAIEWSLIILAIVAVMTLELVNTALEQLIDFLNPERHPTIKTAKDMLGGAVLVAAIGAAVIGVIIIIPKILDLFVW